MPGRYFDIQVNGYAGVDFNQNSLTIEQMEKACQQLREDNVEGILIALITSSIKDLKVRIKNIVSFCKQSQALAHMVRGIHLEGPFINSTDGFRGAHPLGDVLNPDIHVMAELLDAGEGYVRLVTLAPELPDALPLIKFLRENKVVVAAGHCDPSLEQLEAAVDAGLSMFTHLGNGCPQLLHRHDNIIQRVLSLKGRLWVSFIADGIHVPLPALKNYIRLLGTENTIVISDAMAASAAPAGSYTLGELTLEVGDDHIVRQPGKSNFAGSAITMPASESILCQRLGFSPAEAHLLASINPQKALGIF